MHSKTDILFLHLTSSFSLLGNESAFQQLKHLYSLCILTIARMYQRAETGIGWQQQKAKTQRMRQKWP